MSISSARRSSPLLLVYFVLAFVVGTGAAFAGIMAYHDRYAPTVDGMIGQDALGKAYAYPLLSHTVPVYIDAQDMQDRDLGWATFPMTEAILRGGRALIGYSETPVTLRVEMVQSSNCLADLWRGQSAVLTASGALTGTYTGTAGQPDQEWGTSVEARSVFCSPYFDVEVPLNQVAMQTGVDGRIIRFQAREEIVRPVGGGSGFTDMQTPVDTEFELVVLQPDELARYEAARGSQRSSATLLLLGSVSVPVLLALFALPLRAVLRRRGVSLPEWKPAAFWLIVLGVAGAAIWSGGSLSWFMLHP